MSEDKEKRLFIQEQIRKKPFYRQRVFQKTLKGIAMTAIFGASFGMFFALAHPLALKYFGEPTKMVIVGETEEIQESNSLLELQLGQSDDSQNPDLNLLEKQQQFYDELTKTSVQLRNCMVMISCLTNELDLFSHMDENADKSAGVVFTKNEDYIWILTCADIFDNASAIKVTFSNGLLADARVQGIDAVTNLAILKVSVDEIPKGILNEIEPAIFGNSKYVKIGDLVIGTGIDYMAFGMVTSRAEQEFCDGSYPMMCTSLVDQFETGGILTNLKGQVVGIINKEKGLKNQSVMVEGFGIAEIQDLVEGIFNGQKFACFGIEGKEVTDILADKMSMPKGIYVTYVKESSPAMKKGIQVMDIISSINGQKIENMEDYMKLIMASKPEEQLKIVLYRRVLDKYEEITMSVVLGER